MAYTQQLDTEWLVSVYGIRPRAIGSIAGILNGVLIYDDELTLDIQGHHDFIPAKKAWVYRCSYCSVENRHGGECKSCGAPIWR